MIWRDLIFDYLWERASPLGRLLLVAVFLGAIALLLVAIFNLAAAAHNESPFMHRPTTTSFTSTARTP